MKRIYKFYFIFNILLIFISSFGNVFIGYLDFRGILDFESKGIAFYNDLVNNSFFNNYKKISGTNTGYGFYGINVAPESYFIVKVYNTQNELICSKTTQNIKRKNTLSRFMVLPCSELNSYFEIEKEKRDKSNIEQLTVLSVKEKYSSKIFKYVGLHTVKEFDKDFFCYTVTLYCLSPKNIWDSKKYEDDFTKSKIKELEFFKQ